MPNTDKTRYHLEPTGQTWTAEQLLDVVVADARLLKRDTDALRRRVTDVPGEKRIPVLMKCIDDLPAGPPALLDVSGRGVVPLPPENPETFMKRKGFTLIELLIVTGIIGFL